MKKTTVLLFEMWLCLLLALPVAAQTDYLSNSIIIRYVDGATALDRSGLRQRYGVQDFSYSPGLNYEVWQNVPFPQTVMNNGTPTTISDVDGLFNDISLQGVDNGDPRAKVSDPDLNYRIYMPLNDIPANLNGQYFPLPSCLAERGRILAGVELPAGPINIIVMDQFIDSPALANYLSQQIITTSSNIGGTHGNKVAYIITETLVAAGISPSDIQLGNVTPFNANGYAEYADVIAAFEAVKAFFSPGGIINFSATIMPSGSENGLLLLKEVIESVTEGHNMLLVSSAGNNAYTGNDAYPGCWPIAAEVTVAGTESCFGFPWPLSNANPSWYEIAAEAEMVLTHDGQNYVYVDGTSYAAPLVAAAAAQIAALLGQFDALQVKQYLLQGADSHPALSGLSHDGKRLNLSAAVSLIQGGGQFSTRPAPPSLTASQQPANWIQAGPNPFRSEIELTIEGQNPETPVSVMIFNSAGQVVAQHRLQAGPGQSRFVAPAPQRLPGGLYFLKAATPDGQATLRLVKTP